MPSVMTSKQAKRVIESLPDILTTDPEDGGLPFDPTDLEPKEQEALLVLKVYEANIAPPNVVAGISNLSKAFSDAMTEMANGLAPALKAMTDAIVSIQWDEAKMINNAMNTVAAIDKADSGFLASQGDLHRAMRGDKKRTHSFPTPVKPGMLVNPSGRLASPGGLVAGVVLTPGEEERTTDGIRWTAQVGYF